MTMKNVIFVFYLSCYGLSVAQDTPFEKDYFQNKRIEFIMQKQNSIAEPHFILNQKEVETASMVLTKPSEFKKQYTFSQLKLNIKKVPDMIDFNNQMQCGPLQLRNSQDMMVGAIVDYIVNKYIFGSFMKTSFN
jgi:hypothetical protein